MLPHLQTFQRTEASLRSSLSHSLQLSLKTLNNSPFKTQSRIKEDILRIIEQFLGDEGFAATKLVLHDEANLKGKERDDRVNEGKKLKRAILDGDWAEVDQILSRPLVRTQKALLYSVYKQQFLEHIEYRELQKAFTLLNKRLKPLERFQPTRTEFQDLCYLLSAKTVHDAPSFKHWEGVTAAREKLAETFGEMVEGEREEREGNVFVPAGRLVTLLEQAVSYQISRARYKPKEPPAISSLLQDYAPSVVPNTMASVLSGHTANIKCARFIGSSGRHLVSGSSDTTLRIWDALRGHSLNVLRGHTGRIWDVDATARGDRVLSASADRTVKNHIATGGYDKIVRLFDVESGSILKTFTGHSLSVSSVLFNPLGNLIVSGSKDGHVRFWDTVSGLNIRTLTAQVGEVTSVDMTDVYLLTSSRDNSIRLWDVRMLRPLTRYKAHSNTSQNFVRASFAHASLVVSGSDDGILYMWDRESGEVVQTLEGHEGVVYGAAWNGQQSLLASYGSDGKVFTWEFDEFSNGREGTERGNLTNMSSTSSLPATIKALKTAPGNTVEVASIPFATREDIKSLDKDAVLVKVRAVGLNPTDWKHAIGPWRPEGFSAVCGCDSAGDVVAVGSDVTHVKVGSRVAGFVFGTSNETNGSYAEYVKFNKAVTFELPEHMSYEEGAAIPIPHLTAVQALYFRLQFSPPSAPTKDPKTILIWGGSTAVGHQAIQLAAANGYKVFTTASPAKHDFLKTIGATACFDYKLPDVAKAIREASGGGVDFALDCACDNGSTDVAVDSIKASGGRVITTLPNSDATTNRRAEVKVEFTLVYTELGYALRFANALDMPAMPEDTAATLVWVSKELPQVLAGWKDGKSAKLVGPKIRKLDGGLEKIIEGFEIMRDGKYSAEKLVYTI
ncbi:hypothetical protein RQP46_006346 [Phenoliferia psychrophenolica]